MRRSLPAALGTASSPSPLARAAGRLIGLALGAGTRVITGVRAVADPALAASALPRVYFANHASHLDIVLIRATLPAGAGRARPVAGSDYWDRSALRRFICLQVLDAVTIDRASAWIATLSLSRMAEALDQGDSLILFPEGTRNAAAAPLLPFKAGLYYLGRGRPGVELVPVWIDNAARALPKGRWLPVPVACTVRYGAPLRIEVGEDKQAFMQRATQAVQQLSPAGAGAS